MKAFEIFELLGALSVGLGIKWAWDFYKAPERALKESTRSAEKLKEELAHYGRRVEDRFVLRQVCERCQADSKHQFEALQRGQESLTEEVRAGFRDVRDQLLLLGRRLNGAGPG